MRVQLALLDDSVRLHVEDWGAIGSFIQESISCVSIPSSDCSDFLSSFLIMGILEPKLCPNIADVMCFVFDLLQPFDNEGYALFPVQNSLFPIRNFLL